MAMSRYDLIGQAAIGLLTYRASSQINTLTYSGNADRCAGPCELPSLPACPPVCLPHGRMTITGIDEPVLYRRTG